MKKIEKMLREAYRAGQDSVSCVKLMHSGKAKVTHWDWCDDDPCKHDVEETDTAEDEAIARILQEKTLQERKAE